jgi:hypothetical protein
VSTAITSSLAAAHRLRGLVSQLRLSRSEAAALLRELADELQPQLPGAVDAELRAAAEREADALRSEGFSVTTNLEIRTHAAARIVGRRAGTLRNWRSSGTGPRWRADHGVVHYSLLDLMAWRRGEMSRTVTIPATDHV